VQDRDQIVEGHRPLVTPGRRPGTGS
jgi:hypothetical protein